MELDALAYYNPETSLFPALTRDFAKTGRIDPAALYLILDWKAPRARTRHLQRLRRIAGSFAAAAREIAADLHKANEPEGQLKSLMTSWEFRLPSATAILAVLYPDTFTVFDIRACASLRELGYGEFQQLKNRRWSAKIWSDYRRFVAAVHGAAPAGLSLRDCDRWLWGRSKQKSMEAEIGIII